METAMRIGLIVTAIWAAVGSPALGQEITAGQWVRETAPRFVTPSPDILFPNTLRIPSPENVRLVADCRQYYAERFAPRSDEDAIEFDQSVICIYLDAQEDQVALGSVFQVLKNQGFRDESGTFVQSAMGIYCNHEHTLVTSINAKFVPRDVMIEEGGERRLVDIEGGGKLAHTSMAMVVSEGSCEDQ